MKFVPPLTDSDKTALETLHHDGKTHRVRQRAQAVLLSARAFSIEQIADILCADRDTVSTWLDNWQARGLHGLEDAPKSGRPRKINKQLEDALLDILQNPSPNLKAVVMEELKKKKRRSVGPR